MAEIFLMEDSPSLRRIITRYLRDADHNVTAFENGSVSRDEAMLARADVLVTDLSMPEVDGRQALRNIHLLRPDLPVIVMTGMERFADPVLDTAFGYLHKPFHDHELLELVDRALTGRPPEGDYNESENESNIANIANPALIMSAGADSYVTAPTSFCGPIPPLPLHVRVRKVIAKLLGRRTESSRGPRQPRGPVDHAPETTIRKAGDEN